jgi:hypothetical protein
MGEMTYHALLEYIRKCKDCGASDDEVAARLKQAGWYSVDVRDALDLYHRLTANTDGKDCEPNDKLIPRPSFWERIAPRHYDPHIVAVAAGSFAIGFVGYLFLAN